MGFTSGAWAISAPPDAYVAHLGPRLLPAMRADRDGPEAAVRGGEWQRAPLPDHRTWYEDCGVCVHLC
ncbi:hypothetical protein EAO70_01010 [Streptomyces sp. adm13(2018)]|uniref:hypothetical protein n=1 Tax=Streptomyces sp. adm13(2018) TaxID=2479007 RepID=UPI0011CEB229|nr:hypothetical protein [Streptomyces sp. adm13(2018)]TXS31977.1 hypothetical protein EAO70_01010 [Streptomyces sp. adm13(2018)]